MGKKAFWGEEYEVAAIQNLLPVHVSIAPCSTNITAALLPFSFWLKLLICYPDRAAASLPGPGHGHGTEQGSIPLRTLCLLKGSISCLFVEQRNTQLYVCNRLRLFELSLVVVIKRCCANKSSLRPRHALRNCSHKETLQIQESWPFRRQGFWDGNTFNAL